MGPSLDLMPVPPRWQLSCPAGPFRRIPGWQEGNPVRSPPDMISARGASRGRLVSHPVWSILICSPAQYTKAKHQD